MSRNNAIINSFVAGEVSDKFYGRTDVQQYNQACEEVFNSVIYPQGGAGRRPGTEFIRELKRANGAALSTGVRLIPFNGSDGTRWNLAITNYAPDEPNTPYTNQSLEWKAYSEVTDNGQTVENIGLATLAGAAAIYSNYYPRWNLDTIQYAQAGDTLIIVGGGGRPLRITYTPSQSPRAFVARPYPDPGEWNTANFTTVTIPAAGTETHRQSPFLQPVVTTPTAAINLTKGTDTYYTISKPAGATYSMNSAWVGKIFKFTRQTQVVVILITNYTNSTTLRGIPIGGTNIANSTTYTYGGPTADQFYEESAWSDERGWPQAVCFFESRLVFAGVSHIYFGVNAPPDEIFFSQVDDIFEMDYRGLVSDSTYTDPFVTSDAFSTTLRSSLLNAVRWLSPKKTIIAGTEYEEFVVQGPSPTKTIGIDNIQTSGETATGSARAMPVRIEAGTMFLDRTKRVIRELAYNFNEDALNATNLNILAEHMGRKSQLKGLPPIQDGTGLGFTQEAFFVNIVRQALPHGIVWALDSYGCMSGVTREREQNVIAWHYHQVSGTVNGVRPLIQALSVLQSGPTRYQVVAGGISNTEGDELWMAVKRNFGKSDGSYEIRTYLERMGRDWEEATYGTNWLSSTLGTNAFGRIYGTAPIFMDCASIVNQSVCTLGVVPLSLVPQGINTPITVIINGLLMGTRTATASGLDLSADLTTLGISLAGNWVAMLGFAYTNRIVPLTPEVQATTGSSMGQQRRVHEIVIGFVRTMAAKFGRRSDQDEASTPIDPMEEVLFKGGANQNDPIVMFTGDKRVQFPLGYETRPRVVIESDKPFPMQVTHIVAKDVVYE